MGDETYKVEHCSSGGDHWFAVVDAEGSTYSPRRRSRAEAETDLLHISQDASGWVYQSGALHAQRSTVVLQSWRWDRSD